MIFTVLIILFFGFIVDSYNLHQAKMSVVLWVVCTFFYRLFCALIAIVWSILRFIWFLVVEYWPFFLTLILVAAYLFIFIFPFD